MMKQKYKHSKLRLLTYKGTQGYLMSNIKEALDPRTFARHIGTTSILATVTCAYVGI